jgi:hypothetical protein
MRTQQLLWRKDYGWDFCEGAPNSQASLVLVFGGSEAVQDAVLWNQIRERYPVALIVSCSTGGEIHGRDVYDDSLCVTALSFDATRIAAAEADIAACGTSFATGEALAMQLKRDDLTAMFLLSDGTNVNGSELIRGIRAKVGEGVVLTGGLAGDGPRFKQTYIGLNRPGEPGKVVAIGFYGSAIQVRHGSYGGWEIFGPERRITRAENNVLFELDGKPALDLYIRYLGDDAAALPGSALLFPLQVYPAGQPEKAVVRTVVGVDTDKRTMIFAGDMPTDYCARLMRGNFDNLIEGAATAAQQTKQENAAPVPAGDRLGILVSCIGRKLLLGQRTGEEIEAVSDVLGPDAKLAGFYSYGEVSPHAVTGFTELHNQTMTITTFCEHTDA